MSDVKIGSSYEFPGAGEINLLELGVERYYSFSKQYTPQRQRNKIDEMIASKEYLYSEKTDGNWARFVIQDGIAELQTRGASKTTGKSHGEIQQKVLFFDAIVAAFPKDTILLGEVYLPSGRDSDVGSILRCLVPKALARQEHEPLRYRIFDILYLDGVSFLNTTAKERVSYISQVVQRINHPLVSGVQYQEMDSDFYEQLNMILGRGGEGVVAIKKNSIPETEAKSARAWKTLKIKCEIQDEIDAFIIGIEAAQIDYTGKDLENWQLWLDMKSGEKLNGLYFDEYAKGLRSLQPITKGHFYNWPGAIWCGVYDDNGEVYPLAKVSGLTENFRAELRDDYKRYHMMPVKLSGMQVSQNDSGRYSIRHPRLVCLRENDLDIKRDCTLSKIIQQDNYTGFPTTEQILAVLNCN